jgi:hypothetical protein
MLARFSVKMLVRAIAQIDPTILWLWGELVAIELSKKPKRFLQNLGNIWLFTGNHSIGQMFMMRKTG